MLYDVLMAPIERSNDTSDLCLTAAAILQIRLKPADTHDLKAAANGVEMAKEMVGGVPRPVLVDMSKARTIGNDARQYYADHSHLYASRCALLSTSVVGRVIANFYLSINKPRCPTRMFTDEAEAMPWLKEAVVKTA